MQSINRQWWVFLPIWNTWMVHQQLQHWRNLWDFFRNHHFQEMMEDWDRYWERSSWERRKIFKMKIKGSATICRVWSPVSNYPFQSRNISGTSISRKLILTTKGKTDINSSEESSTWTHAIHLPLLLTKRYSSFNTSPTSSKLAIKMHLNLKKVNPNLKLMSGKLEIGVNAKLTSTKSKSI